MTISIKNPSNVQIRGDYSFVYYKNEPVAMILTAEEITYRRVHSGENHWAIFNIYYNTQCFNVTEEDSNPNIPLGKRHGKWIGFTIQKNVPTRNSGRKMYDTIPADELTIVQYSSLVHPLKLKWEYRWCSCSTKQWKDKTAFLFDGGDESWHNQYNLRHSYEDISRYIPDFQERYKKGDEVVSFVVTDNNNFLVHDFATQSCTWYNCEGKSLKYTNIGERRVSRHYRKGFSK